jgi:peptidoglycan hydrolase-like protein with peptidoglycan-binding domain
MPAQSNVEDPLLTQVAQTLTASAPTTTPTLAVSPTVTSTPLVTVTPSVTPCNMASFVADVTTPDDTSIKVNTAFTKIWRLKNVGSCTWTSGYQLVFDSGDSMGGPASQQLTAGTVSPGGTLDISVNLTTPASAGTYKGNWKIREPGGATFGLSTGAFWVQIKAATEAAAEWPTYEQGDEGVEIYAIQLLLNAHGAALVPDGKFGPLTQTAVEDFQNDEGLSEDIVVGPQTWEALIIQVAQGKTGPEVRAVQRLLKIKFGYAINIDGIFGADTKTAVKDFQSDNGLVADGIVGPLTWKKLINE